MREGVYGGGSGRNHKILSVGRGGYYEQDGQKGNTGAEVVCYAFGVHLLIL